MQPFKVCREVSFDHALDKPGLYFIEIKFPFTSQDKLATFLASWGLVRGENCPPSMPRASQKKAMRHATKLQDGDFIPFYLGKNLKVQSRLKQHLVGERESKTYGLKLLCRPELLEGCELRAGAVAFDLTQSAYFCVSLLEAALRKRVHPIVGKQ